MSDTTVDRKNVRILAPAGRLHVVMVKTVVRRASKKYGLLDIADSKESAISAPQ